jgi:tetratricopeptide (TPR) repeat protein
MTAATRRSCCWGGWLVVLCLVSAAAWGAAPPAPSGKLTAEQQKRLAELGQELGRAAHAGKMAEALRLARQIERWRRRWQGSRHWQAVDARYYVERWQRLARLGQAEQKEAARALRRAGVAEQLQARHRYAEAAAVWRDVLGLRRKVLGEEHPDTATSYNEVAVCLNAQGKHAQALPLYEKALAIWKKVLGEEHPDTALSYNNLAFCLNEQGRHAQALPLCQKALAINRKVLGEGHPSTARSYNNLAGCLNAQGKHAQALPLFEKALAIWKKVLGEQHPDTATSCNHVALCLNAQGKHREAIRFWQAALLGHDAGRVASASIGFDRALHRAGLLTPRTGLVLAHARLKEPRLAWQHAEADLARPLLDDLGGIDEAAALRARVQTLGERLLPLLSSGKLSEEQSRQRQELAQQQCTLLKRLARDVAERSARLVWPLQRIQEHLPADAALVLWVSARGENWACVLRARGEPHWRQLKGSGPRGRWTMDDYFQPERLREALADRNSSDARRRPLVQAVRRLWFDPLVPHLKAGGKLSAVRRLFVVPSKFMAALPAEVMAPELTVSYTSSGTLLAQALAGHRPLNASSVLALGDPVFTTAKKAGPPAHGLLITVVLPGSNAARAGWRSGDVLLDYRGTEPNAVEDLQPLLAKPGRARATLWRDGLRQRVSLPAGPLGVVFDRRSARAAVRAWRRDNESLLRGDSYQALPGTRFEVQALRRLLGKRCQTLLGSDACEQQLDTLELKQYRVLHLATHGKIDLGTPANSALILSRDRLPSLAEQAERAGKGQKVYTGELRVGTILKDWKLDADLVVLSACETALGRPSNGQGLLGFAYALQKAGARSVLLSRWKVDDTATALLMLRFYENLLGSRKGTKPQGRAAALQEAKRWLREVGRKEAGELAARHASGVLRGTEAEARPLVKGTPGKLTEGDRPFARPAFWAAFTLLGDPD